MPATRGFLGAMMGELMLMLLFVVLMEDDDVLLSNLSMIQVLIYR